MNIIPQKAIDLILNAEGVDQPWQWPGGASGITIGYGYDLGYEQNFVRDWDGYLASDVIARLQMALGKTGENAHIWAPRFSDIMIGKDIALAVFENFTLPHYTAETILAFPGLDRLPTLVRGALVSLVFNRGTGMIGARRTEMRAIRDAVTKGDLREIARQLRAMKRLWAGQGLDGLLKRREAEAQLVEEAMNGASDAT